MKPWRAYEAAVAAYFGATRRTMRKFQLQGPDVNHIFADLEVKTRQHIPGWLTKPLQKTKSWSKSKIAAVIWLNPETDAVRDGVVVVSVPDFKMLLETYSQQSGSEQSCPPSETPSKSPRKAKPKYRWPRRRLISRRS